MSDDQRVDLALIIAAHQPSRWRSFTNDNEILRCCGQDFGNPTRKAKRGDSDTAWAAYSEHLALIIAAALTEPGAES